MVEENQKNQENESEKSTRFLLPPKIKEQIKITFLFIWDFLKIAILAAVIVLPIRYFIFQPFIVKGESMVPNFHSGDYLIIDQISYRIKSPKRGDVIVFRYPLDISQRYIKRIIGLPGETIEVKNGEIKVLKNISENLDNNKEALTLNENNYLPDLKNTEGNLHISLLENQYFVLGDNRDFSYDSRRWGILPQKDIIGKVILRIFPVSDMFYFSGQNY